MSNDEKKDSEIRDAEVTEKAARRRFGASYKLRIVAEADACAPGELGELLRREGLYSSQVSTWRRQRDEGALNELGKKRGRKPKKEDRELERLRRENAKLKERVRQAELIIDVQKKVSEVLGIPLASPNDESE